MVLPWDCSSPRRAGTPPARVLGTDPADSVAGVSDVVLGCAMVGGSLYGVGEISAAGRFRRPHPL
ncbi:hypothetical protein GCM10010171_51770 [Actinokineospora fastidiosa]|uniref:Uncharacterized protein n=1 Tax=Actinokineospora fastidiosa TaxID=1816 RepID=A0A918GPR4_9PSEU|nr:hypothetical protein GCM10010171_51770 [Actinokineospora fastidiosa]